MTRGDRLCDPKTLSALMAWQNRLSWRNDLDKDTPVSRPVQRIGTISSHAILGGLHHHYVRG